MFEEDEWKMLEEHEQIALEEILAPRTSPQEAAVPASKPVATPLAASASNRETPGPPPASATFTLKPPPTSVPNAPPNAADQDASATRQLLPLLLCRWSICSSGVTIKRTPPIKYRGSFAR